MRSALKENIINDHVSTLLTLAERVVYEPSQIWSYKSTTDARHLHLHPVRDHKSSLLSAFPSHCENSRPDTIVRSNWELHLAPMFSVVGCRNTEK